MIFATGESLAGGWFRQDLTPPDLYVVESFDLQNAVALDAWGRVLASADRGQTWTARSTGSASAIFGLSFLYGSVGTAVGDAGTILRTTDRGANWAFQFSGTTVALIGVNFVDFNHGAAVGEGGTILHTTDGGDTWTPQDSGTTQALFGVGFFDIDRGIAVGDAGNILRTTDGGGTWNPQISPTTRHLQAVRTLDANIAVVVGDSGTILRTTDGGQTWTDFSGGMNNYYGLAFAFNQLYVAGCVGTSDGSCQPAGVILHSNDLGLTFTSESVGRRPLFAISYSGQSQIAVGQAGTIVGSPTGAPLPSLNGVSLADASVGFAVGDDAVMRTADSGVTWTFQSSGTSARLYAVSFVTENTGTAVGERGTILRTDDSGGTWTRQASGTTLNLYGVSLLDANTGTVVGSEGTILRTNDGGATWTPQASDPNATFEAVAFADANLGLAVGFYGYNRELCRFMRCGFRARTTDGGLTWTGTILEQGALLFGVAFGDPNTAIAVGYSSIRTSDGGETWASTSITGAAVSMVGPDNATVVGGPSGASGGVWRTLDGGDHWLLQYNGILSGVSFADPDNGIAVGPGVILRFIR